MFQDMRSSFVIVWCSAENDCETIISIVCIKMNEFRFSLSMCQVICSNVEVIHFFNSSHLESIYFVSFFERISSLESGTIRAWKERWQLIV